MTMPLIACNLKGHIMQPIVAWTEIPVTDLNASAEFYAKVFGWDMNIVQMGPNEVAVFNGVDAAAGGHLYPGKPAAGTTSHLTLPDTLEEGAERVRAAGGQIHGDPVEIPDGRFQYASDLDGNSIGLFQLTAR